MLGTLLLFNSWAKVLFDYDASHSFISLTVLDLKSEMVDRPLGVRFPLG